MLPDTHDFLQTRTCEHSILPSREIRVVFGFEVDWPSTGCCTQGERYAGIPHDKCKICICTLISHKPIFPLQITVKHPDNTLKFVTISLLGGGELFGMENVEPIAQASAQVLAASYFFLVYENYSRNRDVISILTIPPVQSMALGQRLGRKPIVQDRTSPGKWNM